MVEDGAKIADGVDVGPYCVIGSGVTIGEGTRLVNSVTLMGNTTVGAGNIIYPYSVLGAPPQDLKYLGGDTRLEIGDNNVIREHVTMNAGTETGGAVTTVGNDNLLMCASHVAHDCHVGSRCIISNQVMLAGHIRIHDAAVLSGGVAIHHFVTVGEYAFIGGLSRVVQDVPPFLVSEGSPAAPRTVNVVGLRRAGFGDEAVEELEKAFRRIFRSGGVMSQTLTELEGEEHGDELARLVEFLRARMAGKHGRALQP